MNLIKRLLLLSVFSFCFLSFADDKAEIEVCITKAVKAGMSMDFNTVKQYCSKDYVKLPNDKKVLNNIIFFTGLKPTVIAITEDNFSTYIKKFSLHSLCMYIIKAESS